MNIETADAKTIIELLTTIKTAVVIIKYMVSVFLGFGVGVLIALFRNR